MLDKFKDTLLLVGDAGSDRADLNTIFKSDYNLLEAENVVQAAMLLKHNSNCIAAVLADIPLMNGEHLRTLIEAARTDSDDPIPVLTLIPTVNSGDLTEYAFLLGAAEVLVKPYSTMTAQKRVQHLVNIESDKLEIRQLQEEKQENIRSTNQALLDALSSIIEHRSAESGNHILRIRRFTNILLRDVAESYPEYNLDDTAIDIITGASALHDIGKIAIPDAVLNKPGPLTAEEFEIMKSHTVIGSQMVEQLSGASNLMYLRYAYNISRYHHERWDGRGYPEGLKGDEIPICAQVVGLADAFDALTTQRVYKPAFPYVKAVNMIFNGECGAFSPKLLECFKHVRGDFVNLAHKYADGYSPKQDNIRMPLPAPEWKAQKLDSLQLSQVKYQTLLHYVNDTVIEMDIDNRLYHVVYNPNPDFEILLSQASFDDLVDRLMTNCDNGPNEEIIHLLSPEEFHNMHRRSYQCRIFSPTSKSYVSYTVTLLRINTESSDQRLILTVFHKTEKEEAVGRETEEKKLLNSAILRTLANCALRCHGEHMVIDNGSENLVPLTGYSQEEISQLFGNSLMEMILPEDREEFITALHTSRGDKAFLAEFRLPCKEHEPVWIFDRVCAHMGADGREYLYHIFTEITVYKEKTLALKSQLERYQLIFDESDCITFDWDLITDTMTCSGKWKERFGYASIASDFSENLELISHFHPDDLSQLREKIRELKSGEVSSADLDARIADYTGKYLWNKLHAAVLTDEQHKPVRIIGIITDIHELKRAALSLKEQAERDSLTKLLNKASTRLLVSNYLTEWEPNDMAALMILDLDNFKSVNDNYGHMYGDAILTQTSSTLLKLFRTHDIIGRIGGDEFLVLLKDIPDIDVLHTRCNLMLNAFRELFGKLMPGLNVSCSIGCALIPEHGSTYSELFQKADTALYAAKKKGKNQYAIYSPVEDYDALADLPSRSTQVDSDEQGTFNSSDFLSFVFHQLYRSSNIEDTIDSLLALIGTHFNVSRVYIFEDNEDGSTSSNTFEWCNAGIPPEIDNLQNLSYETDLPGWKDYYDEEGIFYCPDISSLSAPVRAVLEPQLIKSMLQCAIMDGNVFRGFVGVDECKSNCLWTQEQVSMMKLLGEMLATFLIKHRTLDKLKRRVEDEKK